MILGVIQRFVNRRNLLWIHADQFQNNEGRVARCWNIIESRHGRPPSRQALPAHEVAWVPLHCKDRL